MKKLIILYTLFLCSCYSKNSELVEPAQEGTMAAAASEFASKPINLRPVGSSTTSGTPPHAPAPIPQDMRNSTAVYLSDNFDEALLKTGRPDFIQYQGNRAFVSYKAKDFTMYEGGECKITFEKRLVQKCEGCNLQRFPCSE